MISCYKLNTFVSTTKKVVIILKGFSDPIICNLLVVSSSEGWGEIETWRWNEKGDKMTISLDHLIAIKEYKDPLVI